MPNTVGDLEYDTYEHADGDTTIYADNGEDGQWVRASENAVLNLKEVR